MSEESSSSDDAPSHHADGLGDMSGAAVRDVIQQMVRSLGTV